jgi:hypothetical protein
MVGCAGDDMKRGGGQRLQREAIRRQITRQEWGDNNAGGGQLLVAAANNRVWYWQGDNRGDQDLHVGALEAAGCGWWQQGKSAKTRQRQGGVTIFLGWAMMCLWAPRSGG